MTKPITIRESTSEDEIQLREVDALTVATLREVYRPKPGVLFSPVERKGKITCIIAAAGTRIIGAIRYWVEDGRFHLFRLGVHPSFRRLGVARQMIDFVARIARDQGARCLSLYTVKETGNVLIFEKLGFETIREQEDPYDESDKYPILTDVYMERLLT